MDGHRADFLHRIPVPSQLGDFGYEPWDTKFARKAKPYFILQLCAYADMLESVQGHRPERFGFILGDNSTASSTCSALLPRMPARRNSISMEGER